MSLLTSLLARDRAMPVSKIEAAIERQVLEGGDIETVLLEQALIGEDTLAAFRAALYGCLPVTRDEVMGPDPVVLQSVPEAWVQAARAVPLQRDGSALIVACAEPPSDALRREIETSLGVHLAVRIVVPVRLEAALAQHFGFEASPRARKLLTKLDQRDPGNVPYVRPPGPSIRPSTRAAPRSHDFDDDDELPELELPAPRAAIPAAAPPAETAAEHEWEPGPHPVDEMPAAPGDDAGPGEGPAYASPPAASPIVVEPEPSAIASEAGAELSDVAARLSSAPPPSVTGSVGRGLRGPLTHSRMLEVLAEAPQRDDVVYAIVRYARQFFDFVGVFSVGKDGARGRMASSSRLPAELMEQVMLPLEGQGLCARAVREKRVLVGDPASTDEDRAAFALLGRQGGSPAGFVPIVLGSRVVLLVYVDRGSEAVAGEDLEPIVALAPSIAEALRRIILEGKALRAVPSSGPAKTAAAVAVPPLGPKPPAQVEADAVEAHRSLVASVLPPRTSTLLGQPPIGDSEAAGAADTEVSAIDLDQVSHIFEEQRRSGSRDEAGSASDPHSPSAELKEFARQRLVGLPRTAPPPPARESLVPSAGRGGYSFGSASEDAVHGAPRVSAGPGPQTELGDGRTPLAQIRRRSTAPGAHRDAPSAGRYSTRLTTLADRGEASVIVDMGDQISVLVEGLLNAPSGDVPPEVSELLAIGEAALPVLVQLFPGPLWITDRGGAGPLPRGPEVSAVARALCAFGEMAAPYVASLLETESYDVGFYGLAVAREMPHVSLLEPIVRRTFDDDETMRSAAVEALRAHVLLPEMEGVMRHLGQVAAKAGSDLRAQRMGTETLAQVRDARALPLLLPLLGDPSEAIVQLAHRGLVLLTGQDFGLAQRKWETWVETWGGAHRVEWLIDSLLHQEESIRAIAGDELKHATQQYLGFHPQLPRREREIVQRKYREWWEREGRSQFAASALS